MAEQQIEQAGTGPVVLEAGRYRLSQAPDGSLVLGRATGLCDTCAGCGCGDQSPPVHVPAMVMRMAKGGMLGRMLGGIGGVPDGSGTDDR